MIYSLSTGLTGVALWALPLSPMHHFLSVIRCVVLGVDPSSMTMPKWDN